MTFLSSLDQKDRRLLLWSLGIAVVPGRAHRLSAARRQQQQQPLPSSYLSGQHGARAAYETLLRSNYQSSAGSVRSANWPPPPVRIPW